MTDPAPGGRPGEVARAQQLAAGLAGQGVHGVALTYVDTAGIARVKAVPVTKLDAAVQWGVGMSPVFDLFLADDMIVGTDKQGGPDGDLRLYPDLDQLAVPASQPGWAWAPVDRLTQDGVPHVNCSRSLLRRTVADAVARGLTFRAAVEIEFVLGRDDVPWPDFAPACRGPAYGLTRLAELSEFCGDVLATLEQLHISVDQIHPEYAPGQFEISVGATDPVAAADRSVLVRHVLRTLAQRHGLRISFAPTVLAGGVGNGGHVHLSAWRDDVNLHGTGTGRYGLTPEAEAITAGILDALPALAAVNTPSPASYLRMQPSHWAGVYACWGHETREAALRVVTGTAGARQSAANLEVKAIDLAANPYLALSGLLAAGLDGLDRGVRLPEEITGDPSRFSADELAARGIRRLPTTLDDALAEFTASPLPAKAWGEYLVDAIAGVRRGEIARMEKRPPEVVAEAYRWVY
ncbi:glutamine synthetase family protein [Cryptosporangium aurantiacum]|uniref:L-glutamine synthetase n=1 Tax=Cryptosporangium aurantiacum TaxID=134849 RepID=A0A1M7RAM5_9ACTN|nr:glutamine synthetase family protein [Cryptosporangium aurantiacum]SHN43182.1 L-glutamine synthetase [Cryptosporangium aurantiacum]